MEGDFIKIHSSLIPLSWCYGFGVKVRNTLFDIGLLKSRSFTMPVISVGNITVGGAGKTPHVEYLIRLLRNHVKVAVLSRGYKRRTKGYLVAGAETTASDIGDEPYQMYTKFGKDGSDSSGKNTIYVAVNANRCNGIDNIRHNKETADTDVILLDDAYQHRYVKPGVNILLVDYHRLIIYDRLLPAGRLREQKDGKRRADVVIITKCPHDLKPMDYRVITKAMDLYPYQKLFFTTLTYGSLYPVFCNASQRKEISLSDITKEYNIILLTGIASPQQLMLDLAHITTNITPLTFADHHRFTNHDAETLNNTFASLPEPRIIITTEKDAARLTELQGLSPEVRESIYALPVMIEFMLDQGQHFDDYILSYVHKNSKNSILSKRKNTEEQQRREHHTSRHSQKEQHTTLPPSSDISDPHAHRISFKDTRE